MSGTSVLIVDDSRFMRTILQKHLSEHGFETDTARNGREAVEKVPEMDPDVVTMDVHMPEMDGIEAVERIMDEHPVPIIMLSAHTEKDADITLDALDKGAVDAIMKPGGEESSVDAESIIDQLVETISAVENADVSTPEDKPEPTPEEEEEERSTSGGLDVTTRTGSPVIIIGSSTGGPRVVESILHSLPVGIRARVLVVQHMPANFIPRFAKRLDKLSEYSVSTVDSPANIEPGEAVVAPGDTHLRITEDTGSILSVEPAEAAYDCISITPSTDVTFFDASDSVRSPCIGIILTGMGDDGSRGVEELSKSGAHIIAQDESSSTVFGMPKQSIQTGHVDEILSDTEIVNGITSALTRGDTQ